MFEMSEQPRTIRVYNLRTDTREFIGDGDAFIAPHTGLPANCTDIAPPEAPAGSVAVFNDSTIRWDITEDHRNKLVYNTQDGSHVHISELGAFPNNTTALPPATLFDKWNGSEWVTDKEAEHQSHVDEANRQKLELSGEASNRINTLSDAVELEMASEGEKEALTSWKKYRVLLSRVDTSTAPNISWPAKPE